MQTRLLQRRDVQEGIKAFIFRNDKTKPFGTIKPFQIIVVKNFEEEIKPENIIAGFVLKEDGELIQLGGRSPLPRGVGQMIIGSACFSASRTQMIMVWIPSSERRSVADSPEPSSRSVQFA